MICSWDLKTTVRFNLHIYYLLSKVYNLLILVYLRDCITITTNSTVFITPEENDLYPLAVIPHFPLAPFITDN